MIKSSMVLFLSRLLAAGLNAGAYLMAAQRLSPENFGRAATIVAVASLCSGIFDGGTSILVLRATSQREGRTRRPAELIDAVALRSRSQIILAAFCLVLFVTAVAAQSLDLAYGAAGAGAYSVMYLFELHALAVLQGVGLFSRAGLALITEKLLALVVVIPLLRAMGPPGLVVAQAVGVTAGITVCLGHQGVRSILRPTIRCNVGRALGRVGAIFLGGISVQFLSLDIPIVAAVAGERASAAIALPSRLAAPLGLLASSVSAVATVRFSQPRDSSGRSVSKIACATALATFALLSPAIFFADQLVERFLPVGYENAVWPIRISMLAVVLAAGSQPVGGALIARGGERALAKALVLSVSIGLMCTVVGARVADATGASFGRLSTSVVALFLVGAAWRASIHQPAAKTVL